MRLASLAWRGLAARRLRTALTIIGVALGVALVTGTLLANQASSEAVRRAAAEILGRAELRVRAFDPTGFTPRAVTTLRQIPGVLTAAAVAERRITISTEGGRDELVFTPVLAYGVDPEDEAQVRSYDVVEGTFLAADRPFDVLVNATWARSQGQGIGDELHFDGPVIGTPPLHIVGLLGDLGVGALARGNVLVLHRETLNQAFDIPSPTTYVDLVVAEGHVGDVQGGLDAQMTEPFIVETVADAEAQLAQAQSGFAGIGFLFGLVALAVGSFLVANTLAMTVSERTREIGLLRAAGVTRTQVVGLFLRQGAVLGLVGGAIGVGAGVGLAALMIGFLRSTRAVLITGLPLNPLALLLALGLGLVVTMAASALPAVAASRISPLDALRPSRQPGRTLWGRLRWLVVLELLVVLLGVAFYPVNRGEFTPGGVVAALAILVGGTVLTAVGIQPLSRVVGRPFEWFFGAEGLLGRANLGRDRARTGLTVGALIIALTAVVTLGAVAESARATANRWVGSILPGGYAIRIGIAVDIDEKQADFESITGAAAASPITEFPVVRLEGERQVEASVAGIDPDVFADTGSLIFVRGTRLSAFQALREGAAVLIPEPVATREDLGVGSTLVLARPGGEAQSFTVAGIIAYTLPARSPDGALLISLADARARFGADTASLWAVVPREDVGEAAFRSAAAAKAKQNAAELLTAPDLAAELERHLDRLIGLFDVLALLTVVIAALGIVNTLGVGVVERAREIAILRSHGMTTGQVQAMVVAEASILGAVGGVAAVVIGLGMAWTVVGGTTPRDFGAGLALPWPLLISVVLLGIGIAALASIYPARLAGRTSIVRSIGHFE
ncbi:MAG TPA: FtsX-like permease family protein [Candidatus Limnocylindria bacterium]|nr:FtsX-like permease family protein [Candidatus Limnocylindria bacterium]